MTPQERFAVNLRKARTEAGISQEELGDRCDLHRTEISLLERAGREPRLATIVKLAGRPGDHAGGALRGHLLAAESRRFDVKRPPRRKRAAPTGRAACRAGAQDERVKGGGATPAEPT